MYAYVVVLSLCPSSYAPAHACVSALIAPVTAVFGPEKNSPCPLHRTMPNMLTELDKPTDLRIYTIAQVKCYGGGRGVRSRFYIRYTAIWR